jgi:NRAMP (natural resistance-associated macrophage protein)-like metal ion transporter
MLSYLTSFKESLKSLGPGIISGAANDDPSAIGTFSQAGAQLGFGLLWTAAFLYPMLLVTQEMCARIGLMTGGGLTAAMKKKYHRSIVYPITGLLIVANIVTIGVDIGAISASTNLILPQVPMVSVIVFYTLFIVAAEILIPYKKYVKILKYLSIFLLAYAITAIIVGGNWNRILIASIIPHLEFSSSYIALLVAIFGASLSPYLYFWQASQEAEEDVDKYNIEEIGKGKPKITRKAFRLMKEDVAIGMAFSRSIAWFIIISTAGSLHANGVTDIHTADEAAKALEPLVKVFPFAGEISKTIFTIGVIGVGLLAIPVMAGDCGYILSDIFGWKQGLSKKLNQAKVFYLVISLSTIAGLSINFLNLNLIRALVYANVINGVVAIPILIAIIMIANDKKIVGPWINGKISNIIGWCTVVMMGILIIIMFLGIGKQLILG